VEECGATGFQYATAEADRKDLWRARHEAWETIHRAHPKQETLIVDAAVPISRYPEMVVFAQQAVDARQAIGYVFGHAGDGNLHVVMAGDPANRTEWGKLEAINQAIVEKAIQVGGTCTGEHGVGIGKRKFMRMEHGESFELMRQIKNLIERVHEPGKILEVKGQGVRGRVKGYSEPSDSRALASNWSGKMPCKNPNE
jgi:D-lactate dehydrogenase (cytochrome)